MNKRFGYVRVAASVPEIKVANVEFNVKEIVNEIKKLAKEGVQVVTFPELSITGYTCGDLFNQDFFLNFLHSFLGFYRRIRNYSKRYC